MRVAPSTFTGPVYALQPDVLLLPEGDRTDFVLVIQDDLIADVLPLPDVAAKWPALHVTRLNGFAIVPGFVDAHHHVIEPFAKAVTFGEPAQMWKRIWMPLEAVADAESC